MFEKHDLAASVDAVDIWAASVLKLPVPMGIEETEVDRYTTPFYSDEQIEEVRTRL